MVVPFFGSTLHSESVPVLDTITMVVFVVAAEIDGDIAVYRIREIFLYCFDNGTIH